ncbi:hypothetical protein M2323_002129 [Rhodoblastus acidophilus]|nr:hypothetical protein [Rhodoblastus acidophilus]MCW2284322.1 hypothetical protein [Rhodoblastus acidophilus]MCW2333200.1 hypothetical protein [Rhodoblastus acidophilus]
MTTFLAGLGILFGGCGLFIGVVAWETYLEMRDERQHQIRHSGE